MNAFQIEQVAAGDAGEYSCEMTEKDVDVENIREFVTVSVFERESEEYMEEKEHSVELIDFVGLEDINNSEYVSVNAQHNMPKLIPRIAMSSVSMNLYTSSVRMYAFAIVACLLCILL